MGLMDFHLKLKACRFRGFLMRDHRTKKRNNERTRKISWMMPMSHGHFVLRNGGDSDDSDSDSIVVQREKMQELELWLFGVFDARFRDRVTKYLQSHLFNKKLTESQIKRKSKETMKKAYLGARAKIRENQMKADQGALTKVGSASVLVVDGDKVVMAKMGDYGAVVCRNGIAKQTRSKHQQTTRRRWIRKIIPVRILARRGETTKQSSSSKLAVGVERIDAETEFIVLASSGIWEVMEGQEAVNLVRHIEDPEEAAECLAKEALARMSKGTISCLVIRFDDM